MDYNHINNFLDKFKSFLFKGEIINKTVAEIITKHLQTPVDTRMIQIKNTVIYVKGSPIFLNEILIHKQKILSDLTTLLPNKHFTDIR